MKKLSVIAAGAVLATTMFGGANASASSNEQQPTTYKKVVHAYNCQFDQAYLENLIKKYNLQVKPVIQPSAKPAAEPAKPQAQAQTTAQTQKESAAQPAPAQKPATNTTKNTQAAASSVSEYEKKVVELVNQERQKAGLAPLQLDTKLSDVAREKSRDMMNKGYFDHQSPTYGSPFDMMKQFGISYKAAGENIAKGQRTPEEVMNGWMNSSGHRANILSNNFTHIGVGYVKASNGTTYWTQMFIGK
ncbi:CAP domain-containing protein [Metabacillus iocasae]|uniref:YkwD family protein n=1 Tax=Priestia iocasae TaxID=2291674 RepID=A0ABS2QUH3_9BACI|nr:CAP domain-containing protein [Metabacillus iocasae]MBM7703131.1 putative YkwD family protein [Metabacillus iocasae]